MKLLFTLLGVVGSCLLSLAQSPSLSLHSCGQTTTSADLEILAQQRKAVQNHAISFAKSPISIPLTIHLVAQSNQQNALSQTSLNKVISDLNEYFLPANVQFFVCSTRLIANDDYFDFNKGLESEITNQHNVDNTLNLYFVNNIVSSSGLVCGYAYLPSADKDHIFMTNNCVENGTTHLHEVGHYFGLFHTHGKYANEPNEELVDGSNCMTAGDDVCDTPADPNVLNLSDSDCNYSGNLKDANGDSYQPEPRNIMSYGNNSCRDFLTDGQYQRIAYFAEQRQMNLECPTFAVDFSIDQKMERCRRELNVQFTADITHPTEASLEYYWDVDNDGKTDYRTQNPQHIYDLAGTYSVSLTVKDNGQSVSETKTDIIVLMPAAIGNFIDDLENGIRHWTIDNPDDAMTWGVDITNACAESNGVVRFNNFNYNAVGQQDYLQSQRIDLRQATSAELQFKLAYAPYSATYTDALRVEVSTDCFQSDVTTIYNKKSMELSTAGTSTVAFKPISCSEWRIEMVDLKEFVGEEISIRFVNINGYGNYLYLDEIAVKNDVALPLSWSGINAKVVEEGQVALEWEVETEKDVFEIMHSSDGVNFKTIPSFEQTLVSKNGTNYFQFFHTTALPQNYYQILQILNGQATNKSPIIFVEQDEMIESISVFPNPATDKLWIEFSNTLTDKFSYQLLDNSGRRIQQGTSILIENNFRFSINIDDIIPGVYWLQVTDDESVKIEKICIK